MQWIDHITLICGSFWVHNTREWGATTFRPQNWINCFGKNMDPVSLFSTIYVIVSAVCRVVSAWISDVRLCYVCRRCEEGEYLVSLRRTVTRSYHELIPNCDLLSKYISFQKSHYRSEISTDMLPSFFHCLKDV